MACLKTTLIPLIALIALLFFSTEKLTTEIVPPTPSIFSSNPIIDQVNSPEPSVKNLTYESIFSTDHGWTGALPESETITLITTGDVMPGRSVNRKMTGYNDFTYPFQKTAGILRNTDLTLINLEAPLVQNCPLTNEGMVFCADQRFIQGLIYGGIDVVNLANNHTLNWGVEGLCQTVELLTENGVAVTGLSDGLICNQKQFNNLAIKLIKGVRFGFLGFNLLDQSDPSVLSASVRAAKTSGLDFLVVSCHWGAEYQRFPGQETVGLAHRLIDAGADLIVGNHPHWYQPLEIYKRKLIVYAHGNFIFDQEWSLEIKTGFIAKHTIYKGKLVDTQIFPIFIEDYSQPRFLTNQEKEVVLEELSRISQL